MVLLATIGSTLLIGALIACPSIFGWLGWTFIRHLGRISFSFYLFHLPILYFWSTSVLLNLEFFTPGLVLNAFLCVISILSTLAFATVVNKVVEQPCIRYGRQLSIRLRAKSPYDVSGGCKP